MLSIRILVIGPYPIVKAQHGGQKRAKALYEFYSKNFSEAKYVGVFHRGQYTTWAEEDLPLGDPAIIAEVDKYPYASELICGEAIDKDIHVRSFMAKLLMDYKPTVIHLEQPFAYLGLKQLLIDLNMKPLIVFGSQNIEYLLKERIFHDLGVEKAISDRFVKMTKTLEYDLSREADLLIAVNHEDAISHADMGAKHIIIAHNGIERTEASVDDLQYWSALKKKEKITTVATFVGSGHPPNWEGFLELVGRDTSFMPAGCKIFIAGGVCDYFDAEFPDPTDKFWSGVKTVGKLEDGRLSALLQLTDLILLPIKTERGSNLKTAEAILSRKKIVATDNTFHGFEKYAGFPNTRIGNNKKDFRRAILSSITSEFTPLSSEQDRLADRVQWEYCLKPIRWAIVKMIIVSQPKRVGRFLKFKMRMVTEKRGSL